MEKAHALTRVSPDANGTDSTRRAVPPSASSTTSFLPSPSRSVTSGKGTGRLPSRGRGRSPTILPRPAAWREWAGKGSCGRMGLDLKGAWKKSRESAPTGINRDGNVEVDVAELAQTCTYWYCSSFNCRRQKKATKGRGADGRHSVGTIAFALALRRKTTSDVSVVGVPHGWSTLTRAPTAKKACEHVVARTEPCTYAVH